MSASLLTQATTAFNNGDTTTAQTLLTQLLRQDARNEQAWLLLAQCLNDTDKQRTCLERVLALNPHNEVAQKMLGELDNPPAPTAPPPQPFQPRPFALPAENPTFTPKPFALPDDADADNNVNDSATTIDTRPPWLRPG